MDIEGIAPGEAGNAAGGMFAKPGQIGFRAGEKSGVLGQGVHAQVGLGHQGVGLGVLSRGGVEEYANGVGEEVAEGRGASPEPFVGLCRTYPRVLLYVEGVKTR